MKQEKHNHVVVVNESEIIEGPIEVPLPGVNELFTTNLLLIEERLASIVEYSMSNQ